MIWSRFFPIIDKRLKGNIKALIGESAIIIKSRQDVRSVCFRDPKYKYIAKKAEIKRENGLIIIINCCYFCDIITKEIGNVK